jgi:hypothetical protein
MLTVSRSDVADDLAARCSPLAFGQGLALVVEDVNLADDDAILCRQGWCVVCAA